MMKCFKSLLFVITFTSCAIARGEAPTWSVLIYMEAPDLHDAVILNITKLLRARTNDNAQISIQLHMPGSTAYRYRVHNGALQYEESIELNLDFEKDISAACKWAYKNNAPHNAFFFWGHGCGILLPTWNDEEDEWRFEHDDALDICPDCQRSPTSPHILERHRGVLLNDQTHTLVTNENMVNIMKTVHETILHKKLDILAIDCCLGAMFEHAYQLSPHVDYLIGCQNCELPDGYDYCGMGKRLSQANCSPRDLVAGIVEDYGIYYKEHAPKGLYTLAGFDCSKATVIKQNLDKLVALLLPELATQKKRRIALKKLIIKECLRFCWMPMYTDLHTMLSVINSALDTEPFSRIDREAANAIRSVIGSIQTDIKEAVVHNVTGHRMEKAHGISIYLPYSHIDSSYYPTPFAQDSSWTQFLATLHT